MSSWRDSTLDRASYIRQRIANCEGVVRAGQRLRPVLEAMRSEAQNLEELEAISEVSDTVARWERYGRHVARLRRVLDGLKRQPPTRRANPGAGRSPAVMGQGCPAPAPGAGSASEGQNGGSDGADSPDRPAPTPADLRAAGPPADVSFCPEGKEMHVRSMA
jgi:hypothetical protein